MLLYLVRHAWAGDRDANQWPDDAARPLTDKGRDRFASMVKKLARRGFAPQVVVTSPYVRARQTADLIAAGVKPQPELIELAGLECGGAWGEALEWCAGRDETEIAWVGHMPDLGIVAGALLGTGPLNVDFAKGAIAAIEFESHPAVAAGTLRWLATAKLLNC